jgi:hypothetical protein
LTYLREPTDILWTCFTPLLTTILPSLFTLRPAYDDYHPRQISRWIPAKWKPPFIIDNVASSGYHLITLRLAFTIRAFVAHVPARTEPGAVNLNTGGAVRHKRLAISRTSHQEHRYENPDHQLTHFPSLAEPSAVLIFI